MVLNVDQSQRRDIDEITDNRITLAIDEENISDNPYIFQPTSFIGNNWFMQGSNFVKLNLTENDSLVFVGGALNNLLQKDITGIGVEFDYTISNVNLNYPILSNISLTCMGMTNYFLVENILTTQGHIDVSCSLFNFSSNVVNTAIIEQGFKVGINFNGNKSNATIKLSNVKVKFTYDNKLHEEILAVSNRISTSFDAYVDEECLILDFLGNGQGHHSGGGSEIDIDTINRLIDTALDNLGVDVGLDLLQNGYARLEVELNRGE